MNKTLLLILCDFLLLNLLALTRWETAEPARTVEATAAPAAGQGGASAEEDIVAIMRLSLEDEQSRRDTLAQQLEQTQQSLDQREQTLDRTEQDRARIASSLEQTRAQAGQLTEQLTAAQREATLTKEQAALLQRDLETRQAEAERQSADLARLEKAQAEARKKIEDLNVAVRVAEQEKSLLRDTATNLRQQVDAERQERLKVQEASTQLAQGVGQLAENTSELAREFREAQPINANTLFSDFLANRVQLVMEARRSTFFGNVSRDRQPRTVLLTDGAATYAVLHVEETPFSLFDPAQADWDSFTVTLVKGAKRVPATDLAFLNIDPRLAAVPVDAAQTATLGVKVYQTALDPYRFPEAVLISRGGAGYGEVPFKVDPSTPGYVKMDKSLVRKLFGDFSPSRGDLVLSKTGELIGIMVDGTYCAVIGAFAPAARFPVGPDIKGKNTSATLERQVNRYKALPLKLQ